MDMMVASNLGDAVKLGLICGAIGAGVAFLVGLIRMLAKPKNKQGGQGGSDSDAQ